MSAYGIAFGPTNARRYLSVPTSEGSHAKGWRPFVWTKDRAAAEKFGSAHAADDFGRTHLPHSTWEVVIIPSSGIPTGDLGGTPAAVRAA